MSSDRICKFFPPWCQILLISRPIQKKAAALLALRGYDHSRCAAIALRDFRWQDVTAQWLFVPPLGRGGAPTVSLSMQVQVPHDIIICSTYGRFMACCCIKKPLGTYCNVARLAASMLPRPAASHSPFPPSSTATIPPPPSPSPPFDTARSAVRLPPASRFRSSQSRGRSPDQLGSGKSQN